ncbi:MAG: (d)CMP kinase [Christensenellales bacterium]|jgi:cytidylate kinase
MTKHMNIAIDGPAGAGKSTLAKEIAQRLGIVYLDTGAMYRAVGLHVLNHQADPKDTQAVLSLLPSADVQVVYEDGVQKILLNGQDVGSEIRENRVSAAASDVAVIPQVRLKLVELQREIASKADVVMDGRDIGTYVLPDANYKFFVTASAQERARRRYLELKQKGYDRPQEEILQEIVARDETDSSRDFAPLKQAEDARLIDTTTMSIEQAVATVQGFLKE